MKSKSTTVFIIFLALSLVGGALVYYGTYWGPSTDDDSAEYFEAARNLASGRGLVLVRASGAVRPLSSRPPFYSVILSIGPLVGVNIFTFARWLDILLFVGFLLILGTFTYHFSGNFLLSCTLVVFFLVSPAFLGNYTAGLAEPLFFTLALSSLFLLISYFQTGRRLIFIVSSILAGLSLLTRLSGAAVVGAGIVGLALFGPRRFLQRLKDMSIFGFISVLTLTPWLYSVYSKGETTGVFNFNFNNLWHQLEPIRLGFVSYGWGLLPYSEYLPNPTYRTKIALLMLIGVLLLVLLGIALKRSGGIKSAGWSRDSVFQVFAIFTFFTSVYVLIFLFSYLFMQIPRALILQRHLSPIDLGVIVAVITLGYYLFQSFHWPRWLTVLPVVLALGLILPYIQRSSELLSNLHRDGSGFSRKAWHQSELMQAVTELPEDMILISNETEAIILWADRRAYRIPELWHRTYVEPFTPFGADQEDPVQGFFRDQGAALILFDTVYWQFWVIYEGESDRRWEAFIEGLYPYVEAAHGTIYFYKEYIGEQ